jgi:hypothetical protein
MATVVATPYFIGASTLTIEEDEYTTAITSAVLNPTTPTAEFIDIGGGSVSFTGDPTWVADIGFAQDWETDDSFVHYMRINRGQKKVAKLTPKNGGRGVEFTIVCQPTAIGGAARSVATSTAQFRVDGQPEWDADPEVPA